MQQEIGESGAGFKVMEFPSDGELLAVLRAACDAAGNQTAWSGS
jgi:hypothetical protein